MHFDEAFRKPRGREHLVRYGRDFSPVGKVMQTTSPLRQCVGGLEQGGGVDHFTWALWRRWE